MGWFRRWIGCTYFGWCIDEFGIALYRRWLLCLSYQLGVICILSALVYTTYRIHTVFGLHHKSLRLCCLPHSPVLNAWLAASRYCQWWTSCHLENMMGQAWTWCPRWRHLLRPSYGRHLGTQVRFVLDCSSPSRTLEWGSNSLLAPKPATSWSPGPLDCHCKPLCMNTSQTRGSDSSSKPLLQAVHLRYFQ